VGIVHICADMTTTTQGPRRYAGSAPTHRAAGASAQDAAHHILTGPLARRSTSDWVRVGSTRSTAHQVHLGAPRGTRARGSRRAHLGAETIGPLWQGRSGSGTAPLRGVEVRASVALGRRGHSRTRLPIRTGVGWTCLAAFTAYLDQGSRSASDKEWRTLKGKAGKTPSPR